MTKGIFKQVTIRFSEVKRNQQSMLWNKFQRGKWTQLLSNLIRGTILFKHQRVLASNYKQDLTIYFFNNSTSLLIEEGSVESFNSKV